MLSPFELLEKLAALVPPPRLNLIRYHGILAPSARDRAQIVPGGEVEPEAWFESTHRPAGVGYRSCHPLLERKCVSVHR